MAGAGRLRRGRLTSASFDHVVTTNAEWATLQGQHIATTINLSGKTVGFDGVFEDLVISNIICVPPVILRSVNPASMATMRRTVLGPNVEGIDFRLFDVNDPATWVENPQSMVSIDGPAGYIRIAQNRVRGHIDGVTYDVFDATDIGGDTQNNRYPQLASIVPDVDTSGVMQPLTMANVKRKNVGNLLADGVHNLGFDGYTNTPLQGGAAPGTITVTSGVITAVSGAGGGHDYVQGAGATAIVTWIGQNKMATWLQSFVTILGGGDIDGPLIIERNDIGLVNHAIKPVWPLTNITIRDNIIDAAYHDAVSVGVGGGHTVAPTFIMERNLIMRKWSQAGDPGDPHPDNVQFFMAFPPPGTPTFSGNIRFDIGGNIIVQSNSRGGAQGFLLRSSGPKYQSLTYGMVENLVINNDATNTVFIERAEKLMVAFNTGAHQNPLNLTLNPGPGGINIGNANPANVGDNVVAAFNVAENGSYTGTDTAKFPNVSTASGITYADMWENPTGTALTAVAIRELWRTKAPYTAYGAVRDTAIFDIAARTGPNYDLIPVYINLQPVDGVLTSTPTTSTAMFVLGGPASPIITLPAGLAYRYADDEAMTVNVSAWSTSNGAAPIRGRYFQLRATSNANPTITNTYAFDLNGTSYTWAITTASVLTFSAVNNQGSALLSSSALWPNVANQKRMIIASRSRLPLAAASKAVIAAGANSMGQGTTTGSVERIRLQSSVGTSLRADITAARVNNTWYNDITLIDFSAINDPDNLIIMLRNGVRQAFNPATLLYPAGGNGVFNASSHFSALCIFAAAVASNVFNGDIAYTYMHWGDASMFMPDVSTDQARFDLNNQFSADNIGADGSGAIPTIGRPFHYLTGDAAFMNGNPGNLGSVARTFTTSGTFIASA